MKKDNQKKKSLLKKKEVKRKIRTNDDKIQLSLETLIKGFKKMVERDGTLGMHIAICSDNNPRIINLDTFPLWSAPEEREKAMIILKDLGKIVAEEYEGEEIAGFIISFDSKSKGPFLQGTPRDEIEESKSSNTLVSIGKSFEGSIFFRLNRYDPIGINNIEWYDESEMDEVAEKDVRSGFDGTKGAPFDIINTIWTSYKFNTLVKNL